MAHASAPSRTVGTPREHRVAHAAGALPPVPRRVHRPAREPLRVDDPHLVRVEHAEVRGRAGHDRATVAVGVDAGDAGGLPRERGERLRERQHAGRHERGVHDGQRGLDAEHAGRGVLERDVFRLARVRCMVGGDRVDRPVEQRGAERVDVGLLAQRRVHLEHRVEARAAFVREHQVLRRALGRDAHAFGLRGAHQVRGLRGGEMQARGSGRRSSARARGRAPRSTTPPPRADPGSRAAPTTRLRACDRRARAPDLPRVAQ